MVLKARIFGTINAKPLLFLLFMASTTLPSLAFLSIKFSPQYVEAVDSSTLLSRG